MRKIRMLAAVLAAALLMSGCSALLEREYGVVEPHSRKYWESGDGGVLRAEDYQELVNGLLTLVAAHTSESAVRIYMPELSLLETEDLLVLAVLWLLYRDSGDKELLIALAAYLFV